MGVGYYICTCCDEINADGWGEHSCDVCNNEFCEDCSEKYELEYNDELLNCPVCSKEFIKDSDILFYVLKKIDATKEQIIEEIKNETRR
jgi:hypothetical protein